MYLLLLENCNLQFLWEVTEVILDFITCFKIENKLSHWVFMFILNSNWRIDIEKYSNKYKYLLLFMKIMTITNIFMKKIDDIM